MAAEPSTLRCERRPAHLCLLRPHRCLPARSVYHDLIPVIVDYLNGDRAKIRTALVLGSLLPLGMFLSWEAVALSLLPAGLADGAADGVLQASLTLAANGGGDAAAAAAGAAVDGPGAALALDPLELFVRVSPPLVGRAVEAFSFLAVGTSFIGTTLSLSGACAPTCCAVLHWAAALSAQRLQGRLVG